MKLDDFEIIRLVGTGNFSEVFHVQQLLEDGTVKDFAMKRFDKVALKRLEKMPEAFMEKHCLYKLHDSSSDLHKVEPSKNIVKLYNTFQDKTYLYMIMEFCERELWDTINGLGLMDHKLALFFIVQLVNALEYCHSQGIVHRDLKAENILIRTDGTLKLIDFGSAVDLKCKNVKVAGNRSRGGQGRTFENFVGTSQFMPPEALRNKTSGVLADLWSLGCTIFQIISGYPPFNAPSDFLTYLLSRKLLLQFPPHVPSAAEDLIRKLIVLDPDQRLGAKGHDLADIKAHKFFYGVDFDIPQLLIQDRIPQPPLKDLCFLHMSKYWERYEEKWVSTGWIQRAKQPHEKAENLDSQILNSEIPPSDRSLKTSVYDLPAEPKEIEIRSRELLMDSTAVNSLNHGIDRVVFIRQVLGQDKKVCDEFYDDLVKEFLEETKKDETS